MKYKIYKNLDINEYHSDRIHYSSSSIKEAFKSLAHFHYYLNTPQEKKLHFDFGNALEVVVQDTLTGTNNFKELVAIFDESKKPSKGQTFGAKINKEWKARFYEDNAGKLIIPATGEDSYEVLKKLKNRLFEHPTVLQLLDNMNYQETVFWTDKNTGLKLKTRPDFWKPATASRISAVIVDIKTDRESEIDKQMKKIINLNYPLQAVLQIEGLRASNLIGDNFRYFWIIASKTAPYNVEVYEFKLSDYEKFRDAFSFKLYEIKQAFENNSFKNFQLSNKPIIHKVEMPFWYKNKMGIK